MHVQVLYVKYYAISENLLYMFVAMYGTYLTWLL